MWIILERKNSLQSGRQTELRNCSANLIIDRTVCKSIWFSTVRGNSAVQKSKVMIAST